MIAESISGRFTSLLSALTSFLVTSIFVSGCDPHTNFPTGSNVFVVATERVHFFDPSAANHLYEIAREALNNAVNHSHGSRVSLSLRRRGADLELTITDDGIGIYPTPAI